MHEPSDEGYADYWEATRGTPCLYPLDDGRRCLECATCQGYELTDDERRRLQNAPGSSTSADLPRTEGTDDA